MAPPVVYESESLRRVLALPQMERRKLLTSTSIKEGVKAASVASVFWVPFTAYLALAKSPMALKFQTRLNASARTAFVIMPIMAAFGMVSEQVASRLANPGLFETELHKESKLPAHKKFANFIHDHPFRFIITMGIPGVAAVFLSQGRHHTLTISQRLMQTRVLGQFYVISVLAGTMAFYDHMSKTGRYEEESVLEPQRS